MGRLKDRWTQVGMGTWGQAALGHPVASVPVARQVLPTWQRFLPLCLALAAQHFVMLRRKDTV